MIESLIHRSRAVVLGILVLNLMLCPVANAFNPVQHNKVPVNALHQSVWFSMHQATQAIQHQHPQEALVYLERAVQQDPKQLIAHYLLAETAYEIAGLVPSPLYQQKYRDLAEAHFEKTFYLNPRVLSATLKLGKLAMSENRLNDADRYYSRALNVLPQSAVLHFNLANVYDEQGRYNKALEEYQQSIALDNSFIYAHNNMGLVYEMMGNYPDAIQSFKKALKLDASYNYARLNLGQAYLKNKQMDKAKALFEDALTYEPQNAWAYLYLGNLYVQQHHYAQAARAYTASIDHGPNYPPSYYLLAAVLHKQHRYDESLKYGKLYLKLSPTGLYSKQAAQLVQFIESRLAKLPEAF